MGFSFQKTVSRRPRFDAPLIMESHEIVRELINTLTKFENPNYVPGPEIDSAILSARALAGEEALKNFPDIAQIGTALAAELTSPPVSKEKLQELKKHCCDLRLHLLAAALSPTLAGEYQPGAVLERDYYSTVCVMCSERSGLCHAIVGDTRVIIVPVIAGDYQLHDVYGDLIGLVDFTPPRTNWVIDCSTLDSVPMLMLANLIALTKKLTERSAELSLAWLSPGSLATENQDKLCKDLNLKLHSEHLFSAEVLSESTIH